MNIGTMTILISANTAGLDQAALHVRRFQRVVNTSVFAINQRLAMTGRMLTQAFTVPLGLIGGVATKTFSDFEYNLHKVTGLVGVAREQTTQWGREMLDMSPQLASTPRELSDALYFVTSAGIRSSEAMDIVAKSAAAAEAGLGEARDVAHGVVSAMNAYGKENLSASHAMDVFVTAIKEANMEASDFSGNIGRVIPAAAALNVELEEVAAGFAALTRTGTTPSRAATYLNRILNTIIQARPQSEAALNEIGSSFEELRRIAAGPQGLIKMLLEIKRLSEIQGGVEFLGDVFTNVRALLPYLDIMGENLEENLEIWDSLFNKAEGSYDNFIDSFQRTFQYKWKSALAEMSVSMVELGRTMAEALIPVMRDIVKMVSKAVNWFANLDAGTKSLIMRITLITVVAGPLLVVLSSLSSMIFGLVGAVIGLTNPIILLAGAIWFLTAAFRNFDSWGESFLGFFLKMRIKVLEVKKLIVDFMSLLDKLTNTKFFSALGGLSTLINPAMAFVAGDLDNYFKGPRAILNEQEDVNEQLAKARSEFNQLLALTWMPGHTPGSGMFIKSEYSFDTMRDSLKNTLSTMGDDIKFFATKAGETILKQFGLTFEDIKNKWESINVSPGKFGSDLGVGQNPVLFQGPAFGGMVMNMVDQLSLLQGPAFGGIQIVSDAQLEEVKLFNDQLKELIKTAKNYNDNALVINGTTFRMGNEFTKVQQIVEDTYGELAKMQTNAMNLGYAEASAADMANVLAQALQEISDKGGVIKPEDLEAVKSLDQLFLFYSKKADEAKERTVAWYTALNSVGTVFNQLGSVLRDVFGIENDGISKLLDSLSKVIQLVSSVARMMELLNAVQVANTAITNANTGAKIKNAAASEIEAAAESKSAAAKIANAVASAISWLLSTLGPLGLVVAVGAVAGILSLFRSGKKQASSAAQMAEGGIVPQGYPNDTYPALLTSGEMVIPPHKLPDMHIGNATERIQKIKLEAKGRELWAVLYSEGKVRQTF